VWPFRRKAASDGSRQAVASAVSRRSYDNPWSGVWSKYIPLKVDYDVYDAIREGIPFIDAGLRKFARYCSGFKPQCDNETTQAALDAWMREVGFLDTSLIRGFHKFSYAYINHMLQYGRAAAEIVLSQSGRELSYLTIVPPRKLRITRRDGRMVLGQANASGDVDVFPRQDLFVFAPLNVEGDNPQGTSLLRSLPFVSNIAIIMENATRQKWQRHGAPAFHIAITVPPDIQTEKAQNLLEAAVSDYQSAWHKAMEARWENQGIIDFFTGFQGDIEVNPIGAQVQELEFRETFRAIQEQIVSSLELAPFMLGLQWSTTERLSQQQADAIISMINYVRMELESPFMQIVDWWQRLTGARGEIRPDWEPVSLQDMVETARAELMEAQAGKIRRLNLAFDWANGFIDGEQAAELLGYREPVAVGDQPVIIGQPGAMAVQAQHTAERLWERYPS